jgi:penicillin-binding protein 1A
VAELRSSHRDGRTTQRRNAEPTARAGGKRRGSRRTRRRRAFLPPSTLIEAAGDGLGLLIARQRRRRAVHRRFRRRSLLLGVLGASLLVLAGGIAVAVFVDVPRLLVQCDLASARPRVLGQTSFVYAADRSRLGAVRSWRRREPVPLERMSRSLPSATIAIEDRRFWSRRTAIDYEAILRAAIANLEAREVVQGGSTITQQLVRARYLPREGVTLRRKLEEACLAVELERAMPKRAILQAYLNQAFYGQHSYGVEAAARTYFGRPARRLNLVQSALLAGLPQAPSRYDPFERPADARERRNEVLGAMRDAGAISPRRYRAAVRRPLRLTPGRFYSEIRAATFFDYVERELVRRFGAPRARRGGLRVVTTLDPRLQRLSIDAIRGWLSRSSDPAAVLVAIDPASGAIRAMTAHAPGRRGLKFNLASQGGRQAGSAFKVFTLAAALEEGISLGSSWRGPGSLTIPAHRCPTASGGWTVRNFGGSSRGTLSLLQATVFSVNTAYAQVAVRAGPARIVDVAHRMGIRSPLKPVCSITLGPEAVSPLEMTAAFATLAARGVRHRPQALRRVTRPSGRVVARLSTRGRRVLTRSVADRVTYALDGVVRAGTGRAAYFGRPAAGKTGTAEDVKDAWFCGYVPQLAACVWVGYPQAEIPLRNVAGFAEVVGGSIPASIWRDFMAPAMAGEPVRALPGDR